MNRLMYTILGLCCTGPGVWAQDAAKPAGPNEALEILKKVDDAAKKAGGAQYDVVFKGVGDAESKVPTIEGKAVLSGWENDAVKKFRFDVKVKRPGSSEVTELSAGGDGKEYWLLDHTKKIAYQDVDPAVLGRMGSTAQNAALVAEFTHPTPFSDEINGKKQELLGSEKVGEEDCYKIRVEYAREGLEATWCFSKKDFLPRSRQDKQGTRETVRQITNLVIGPKLDEETFKFKLPEGYTQSDDFAP